ncbi:MAG: hypothetical protein ACYTGC_01105 [Planctomycetota bacterium]|jgi:hypothetical protein
MHRHARTGPALWLLAVVSGVHAQSTSEPEVGFVDPPFTSLKPLDQRVEDFNPLSTSLRVMESGLRQPADFDQVFRLPGSNKLMRAEGALYAVFPQSVYVRPPRRSRQRGLVAAVPPDTLFYIGAPPTPPDESEPAITPHTLPSVAIPIEPLDLSHLRTVSQIDTALRPEAVGREAQGPTTVLELMLRRLATARRPARLDDELDTEHRSVVTDPDYRANRMRTLLQRAAAAGEGPRRRGGRPRRRRSPGSSAHGQGHRSCG